MRWLKDLNLTNFTSMSKILEFLQTQNFGQNYNLWFQNENKASSPFSLGESPVNAY